MNLPRAECSSWCSGFSAFSGAFSGGFSVFSVFSDFGSSDDMRAGYYHMKGVQTTDAILPYAVIPDTPGTYVCGCLERWVSIHLQAVRALNLAWALPLAAPARVC